MKKRISIIGGGSWGTALSIHFARAGHRVQLWVYEEEVCADIRQKRENTIFLEGFAIPKEVTATSVLEESLHDSELVIFVVPSEHARRIFERMRSVSAGGIDLVIATKGIECDSLKLMSEVAHEALGDEMIRRLAVLSGPSFAAEVAKEDPTAVVVSSVDPSFAEMLQRDISFGNFRLYTNTDIIGVQLAGSLKNVVAIAAGIVEGLQFGHNTRAALITRGASEIRRLGTAMGGEPSTFAGLAGIGDLILTCTGTLSRNRQVGERLGRGEKLDTILAEMKMVAEGIRTTIAANQLARKLGVEMPITFQVYSVLYENKKPADAIQELLSRPLKEED